MEAPTDLSHSADWLHAAATAHSGLDDFGPDDYREGLGVLLRSLQEEAALTVSGRQFALGNLIGVLVARLYAQKGWKEHPEYLGVKIERPLVITGIPRTGTTALHKLLSVDPQFQGIERWLASTPMPRPPREAWATLPEFRACAAGLEAFLKAAPGMAAAHDMSADSVDECLDLLQQSFVSNAFASTFHTPAYLAWLYQTDELASYRRYADVLRLIGLGSPGRRWLLKNPGHTWELDSLLAVFPDACIVQTHRDPAKALPSLCSVLQMARQVGHGENADPAVLGPVEAHKWLRAVERSEEVKARRPERFFDVVHSEFYRDPLGVVRAIYRRFDLALSAATLSAMSRWLEEQPPEQKGSHRYSAETFGLSEAGLRSQYSGYIERYSLV